MSIFATERVPSPVVVLGVVDRDIAQRSLSVRPSELASGYERLNWRTAHMAFRQAEETGRRSGGTVYASGAGRLQIAPVVAGDYQSLLVHVPQGEQAFTQLISKPGLFAWVSVDRSTGRFIGVSFNHRP